MRARIEQALTRAWMGRAPLLSLLLLPLSFAWTVGATVHRFLYSSGLRKRTRLPVPVISVGNLVVGGAGKTPVTMALAQRLLDAGRKVAVLSRGYGRTSREPIVIVSDGTAVRATADEGGDEPVLLAHRVPGLIVVTGSSRAIAGRHAIELGADLIVLDDGFSHHALHRDADVLVIDAELGFGNGRLLPAGPLREPLSAIRRASLAWLTKCPDARSAAPTEAAALPLVRSSFEPRGLVDLGFQRDPRSLDGLRVIGVCGIARPGSFERTLAETGANVRRVVPFGDHHAFTPGDVADLASIARSERVDAIVTTEKDAVRLPPGALPVPVLALQMDVRLLGDETPLDDLVRRFAPGWKAHEST